MGSWNDIANLFVERNIKTNLDIGCANNHFSFLVIKKMYSLLE